DSTTYPQGSLIGDLTAVATAGHDLHAIWTDGRNLDDDIFQSKLELALFTDVDSLSAATGGTATLSIDPGPPPPGAAHPPLATLPLTPSSPPGPPTLSRSPTPRPCPPPSPPPPGRLPPSPPPCWERRARRRRRCSRRRPRRR